MKIGISSACLYPRLTEEAVEVLLGHGIKTLEVFINSDSELQPAYLKELRRRADAHGAQIVSLHPFLSGMEGFLFFTHYQRRFEDGLEQYKRFFEAVKILGGDIVVFHGAHKGHELTWDFYFERYGKLVEQARCMGVRLCHENVERTVSRSPDFFVQLRRYLPGAQTVFDLKQGIRAGFAPMQMLDAMDGSLAHIHMSDHTPKQDCLPPGQGNLDILGFLRRLQAGGYGAALVTELYSNNYESMEDLVASHNYMEFCLSNLMKPST